MPLDVKSIRELSALSLRKRVAASELTAREIAEALLAVIEEREPRIEAWAWIDPAHVLSQADSLDAWQRAGRQLGALHGVPVALKDIIDTRGIPTEYGCLVTKGHVPEANAAVAEKLYAAGALVMGKTVTTELAFMHPGPTRNPLNADHTPGGSSSGSAAAVAAGMVPLALGTQTGGSVTRPAAYCGIVGFKPSFGAISRAGILTQSPTLDTVGIFSRTVPDAALLAGVLSGRDLRDPASTETTLPHLLAKLGEKPRKLRLALVALPGVALEHYVELKEALDGIDDPDVEIIESRLPDQFERVAAWREMINFVEMAYHFRWLQERDGSLLSEKVQDAMSAGRAAAAIDYIEARDAIATMREMLAGEFGDFDAILSTATAGRAPEGLQSTGTAICNGLWTFTGAPSVNVPIAASARSGLPISVQVTAPYGRDCDCITVASTLWRFLS